MKKNKGCVNGDIRKVVDDVLMEGSERYPYARMFVEGLFGMTPDDYRLNGWTECASFTTKATLTHVKSTIEENMKKCNVEDVIGVSYGFGYRQGVRDVLDLLDEMIKQLNEEDNAKRMD
mgnify:CR=1 FL=1